MLEAEVGGFEKRKTTSGTAGVEASGGAEHRDAVGGGPLWGGLTERRQRLVVARSHYGLSGGLWRALAVPVLVLCPVVPMQGYLRPGGTGQLLTNWL